MSDGNRNTSFSQAALEHLDALYGFAITLTRNQTEAEDLVQETYLRAVRAFGRLLPDSNLKGWMFAIMRNTWLNQIRHLRSGPHFVELDAEEEDHSEWLGHLANDPQNLAFLVGQGWSVVEQTRVSLFKRYGLPAPQNDAPMRDVVAVAAHLD